MDTTLLYYVLDRIRFEGVRKTDSNLEDASDISFPFSFGDAEQRKSIWENSLAQVRRRGKRTNEFLDFGPTPKVFPRQSDMVNAKETGKFKDNHLVESEDKGINTQTLKTPSEQHADALEFFQDVKKTYAHDPSVLENLLHIFHNYVFKHAAFQTTYSQVVSLFKDNPHLVIRFNHFLRVPPNVAAGSITSVYGQKDDAHIVNVQSHDSDAVIDVLARYNAKTLDENEAPNGVHISEVQGFADRPLHRTCP
ncbi:hypothetical protein SpCBS45565_g00955 [Spizellomyces sp. 'palustris']|nr:hypothetical protein SpCBS45565_g00955 [Spizellomyces sp. 'palustris']